MLRHPSRHYIYFLFSKRNRDVASIIAHLGELRLPLPQEAGELKEFARSLLAERERVEIPPGFDPLAQNRNEATSRFLDKWKITDMWLNQNYVGTAADILFIPQMRRMLETLLLGPLDYGSIARHVRGRFGLSEEEMNTGVVRAYSHYYWEYGALNTPEWRELIWSWHKGVNDDYMTALMAPRTQGGAHLAVAAADRGGHSLDAITQYSTMRDYGFRMFMQHALTGKPSLSRTQGAMMALNIVTMTEDELDKRRGGSAELIEELKKIEAVYDTTPTTTINELPVERHLLPAGAKKKKEIEYADPE